MIDGSFFVAAFTEAICRFWLWSGLIFLLIIGGVWFACSGDGPPTPPNVEQLFQDNGKSYHREWYDGKWSYFHTPLQYQPVEPTP